MQSLFDAKRLVDGVDGAVEAEAAQMLRHFSALLRRQLPWGSWTQPPLQAGTVVHGGRDADGG